MSSQICLPGVLHIPHRNYVGFVAQSFGFLSLSLLANVALAMCHTACAAGIIIIACPARPVVRSPIEAGIMEAMMMTKMAFTHMFLDLRYAQVNVNKYSNLSEPRHIFRVYIYKFKGAQAISTQPFVTFIVPWHLGRLRCHHFSKTWLC